MICQTCGTYDLTVPKWFAWDGDRLAVYAR